jgi:putative redox protein
MAQDADDTSRVTARITGKGRFQTEVAVRGGAILLDEPPAVGGDGTGPTPYELLSAALAACTAMTLRLYAERKGLMLPPFTVEAAHSIIPAGAGETRRHDRFERRIAFDGPLEPALREKMIEIADKCPVHRTLIRGFEIVTDVGAPAAHAEGEPPRRHADEMEAACRE